MTKLLTAWALLGVVAFPGCAGQPSQTYPDPPAFKTQSLPQYQIQQIANPKYVRWAKDNMLKLDYDMIDAAYTHRWEDVHGAEPVAGSNASVEVVMVTQTTISRLPTVQTILEDWAGPVSIALFIEYPASHAEAAGCRDQVVAYFEALVGAWHQNTPAPPLAVSFVHARTASKTPACDVPAVNIPEQNAAASSDSEDASPESPEADAANASDDDGTLRRHLLGANKPLQAQNGPLRRPPVQVLKEPYLKVYNEAYPTNVLRNLAWKQVPDGAFVFLNDVDFVPSPGMYATLVSAVGDPQAAMRAMRDEYYAHGKRQALIVPAFEARSWVAGWKHQGRKRLSKTECRNREGCQWMQQGAVPRDMATLRAMHAEDVISVFDAHSCPAGHRCYPWEAWLAAEPTSVDEWLPADHQHPCEPYVIALSDAMPRYDERFRGRCENKAEQLLHMNMWGFEWRVLPGAFLVHLPHAPTKRLQSMDLNAAPQALLKSALQDIELEPEFRRKAALRRCWNNAVLYDPFNPKNPHPLAVLLPVRPAQVPARKLGVSKARQARPVAAAVGRPKSLQAQAQQAKAQGAGAAHNAKGSTPVAWAPARKSSGRPVLYAPEENFGKRFSKPQVPTEIMEYIRKQVVDSRTVRLLRNKLFPVLHHVEYLVTAIDWEQYQQPGSEAARAGRAEVDDVVLMTQSSPDRLPFVRRMMALYNGPISLAVYIPFPASSAEGNACRGQVLDYMRATLDARQGADSQQQTPFAMSLMYANEASPMMHCNLTEASTGLEAPWRNDTLWRELYGDATALDFYYGEYPVGSMRQLAKDAVRTSTFLYLADADFVFPANMAERLRTGASGALLTEMRRAWARDRTRQALVIPAFERIRKEVAGITRKDCASSVGAVTPEHECWMYLEYDVPLTKDALRTAVQKDGTVEAFHVAKFQKGHGCYGPNNMFDTDESYTFRYEHPCEPYPIALADAMPPFDERYRGRVLDKIAYLSHMAAWGFEFRANVDLFMVHLPHVFTDSPAAVNMEMSHLDYPNFAVIPYVLSRVHFEDLQEEPEFRRPMMPYIPGLNAQAKAELARSMYKHLILEECSPVARYAGHRPGFSCAALAELPTGSVRAPSRFRSLRSWVRRAALRSRAAA